MLQKIDIYYEDSFTLSSSRHPTFLQAQHYYEGRPVLRHQSLLYLLFPGLAQDHQPHTTFLATGSKGLQVSFQHLERTMTAAQKHARAFEATFQQAGAPDKWTVKRLSDQENLSWLYA
jgi:hypothetical protein